MSGSVSKKKWVRISAAGTAVGTNVAVTVQLPFCGWVRRARMSGPGGANLTLNVSETLAGSGFAVVLSYSSTATPLNEEEDPGIFYQVAKTDVSNPLIGTLYISGTSSVNGAVTFQFDIEPAV